MTQTLPAKTLRRSLMTTDIYEQLQGVDLKLLLALQAFVEERSVSKAAIRLNLSQPAMSACLSRLRDLLGDQILVRSGKSLLPTSKAVDIANQIRPALEVLGNTINSSPSYNPLDSQAHIRIAATDYTMALLIPKIASRLEHEAPNIKLTVAHPRAETLIERLLGHQDDLAIGVFPNGSSALQFLKLGEEDTVCVVDQTHPCAGLEKLTLSDLEKYNSATTRFAWQDGSLVDDLFRESSNLFEVQHRVSSFLAIPHMVVGSTLIGFLPRRIANLYLSSLPISIIEPPTPLPPTVVFLAWRKSSASNENLMWLVDVIRQSAML